MSRKVSCWNSPCFTDRGEMFYSSRLNMIQCKKCIPKPNTTKTSFEAITCKRCGKTQANAVTAREDFYFVSNHAPTVCNFFCEACIASVQESNAISFNSSNMREVNCWMCSKTSEKGEICYSGRLNEIHCRECTRGNNSYDPIVCKNCSRMQFDKMRICHKFHFEPVYSPTTCDFYCSDCAVNVRQDTKQVLSLLAGLPVYRNLQSKKST